jgi:hypothetical protein
MTEDSTSIALWAEETFGKATALSTAIRAQKELTELIEKLSYGVTDENEIMTEVADVQIVLARVQRFFPGAPTAEEAVQAKMKINRARRWMLDGKGHGQHIKEEGTEVG